MTYRSNNKDNVSRGRAGLTASSSFFQYSSEAVAKYDWNADRYASHQQKFGNDLEELSKQPGGYPAELWGRPQKFSDHDFSVTIGGKDRCIGASLAIPGVPVIGITEMKYRTNYSTTYPTTVCDTDKMVKLAQRVAFTSLPCWILFRFQDCDMYYLYNCQQAATYNITNSYNRSTVGDNPQEWDKKPVTHIPMSDLQLCRPDMFKPILKEI